MREFLRSVLTAPRVPGPPARSKWDWMLVAGLIVLSLGEGVFADEVVWRELSIALALVLPFATLFRRTQPLAMIAVVFITMGTVNVVSLLTIEKPVGLANVGLTTLILTYTLFRWASGRHAAIGLVMLLGTFAATDGLDPEIDFVQAVAGSVVWLVVAAVATTVRLRATARVRAIEHARMREREQLARELHDTVAHHVSAIAIQAQAGLALHSTQPDAAAAALRVIEEAASRTLTEMRKMVSALRSDDEPSSAPVRCLADVARLAERGHNGQVVEVELTGNLNDLGPTIEAGLYRIAQESITNSRRHARHATRVSVQIQGDADAVHLRVTDDGDPVARDDGSSGFGLIGMSERASLLGGDLRVGPGPERGWVVAATLPRGSESS